MKKTKKTKISMLPAYLKWVSLEHLQMNNLYLVSHILKNFNMHEINNCKFNMQLVNTINEYAHKIMKIVEKKYNEKSRIRG